MEGEKEGEEELTSSSIASREDEVREVEKDSEEDMSSDRDSTGEEEWFWKKIRGQTLSTEVMKCSIEQDEDQRDELSDQQPTGKRLKGLRMNRRLQELRQGEERPKKGPEGEYLPENGDIQINETSVQLNDDLWNDIFPQQPRSNRQQLRSTDGLTTYLQSIPEV
ncbi:hypothetical protein AAC387_Pa01g3765 [Persea americana]